MRKPFLTGYKRHNPPGFQNFKFLNFSVYTTLSVPKHPISIKKLRTLRRVTKPESDFRFVQFFFYTPCINIFIFTTKMCKHQYINDLNTTDILKCALKVNLGKFYKPFHWLRHSLKLFWTSLLNIRQGFPKSFISWNQAFALPEMVTAASANLFSRIA